MLFPVQQLLELLAKIPGLSIAQTGANKIKELRRDFNVPAGAAGKSGNTTVVHNSPTINVSSELTEKSKQDIKDVLDEHAKTIASHVNEQNRIDKRLSYAQ